MIFIVWLFGEWISRYIYYLQIFELYLLPEIRCDHFVRRYFIISYGEDI